MLNCICYLWQHLIYNYLQSIYVVLGIISHLKKIYSIGEELRWMNLELTIQSEVSQKEKKNVVY